MVEEVSDDNVVVDVDDNLVEVVGDVDVVVIVVVDVDDAVVEVFGDVNVVVFVVVEDVDVDDAVVEVVVDVDDVADVVCVVLVCVFFKHLPSHDE